MHYDVFNGDADGIIALLQLRLNEPKQSTLITGVKRDNSLLKHVDVTKASAVVALDISMEKNTEALTSILANDIPVFYCDHHRTGAIPQSDKLTALVDTSSEVCTSLLINNKLGNKYIHWAIAAAYGDNLVSTADQLADEHKVTAQQADFLCELGTLINYNGYGASLDDLHFDPAVLYRQLSQFTSPFSLQDDQSSVFYTLQSAYRHDHQRVTGITPYISNDICEVYVLPCEAWARRISGVYGNELANRNQSKAHAVLTLNSDGSYLVSVRAPLENRVGADDLCAQFTTGGGRKAAAGINKLPAGQIDKFVNMLASSYA
ncbi:DHH family phosphoesterase [Moritella yayanosii]|uniref:Acetyltransferase n=1 Tax=Moritella yayanosii TaxID=69539 RepID=A0A330LSG7_9GAMM|nr:DHH family phosphoesterase [Moritella yayanosii]SQD79780.1 Acetyltransferase [Moritella yayanosii]